jgi:hypothetical protein
MSTLTLGQVYSSAPVNTAIQELGNVSGALSVDLSAGGYITATATGATAWTFSIADATAATMSSEWTVRITNGATTQTWAVLVDGFASTPVKWPSGTAPSLTASGTDLLRFVKGVDNDVIGYRIATNIS